MFLSMLDFRRKLFGLILLGWLLTLLMPGQVANAQTPPPTWVASYDGGGASAMAVDAQGNVYVTGTDATIKYDTNGNQLWVARYNGPNGGYNHATAVAVDAQGNVYVTGSSAGASTRADYTTIKYDADGNQLWVARYSGRNDNEATALAVDAQGNVYVTGYSADGDGRHSNYVTVKYNTSGQQLWLAIYNAPHKGLDQATALSLDAQGNVYVTGFSTGENTGDDYNDYDYATIKYDADGNQLWVARYNGLSSGNCLATALALDAQGNVYVTGTSENKNRRSNGYATVKYDTNGKQLWAARYNGPGGNDIASALVVDAQGNVYVTGTSDGYATIKYDANGNQLWGDSYSGGGATALVIDAQGSVYVTGGGNLGSTTLKYGAATTVSPNITTQVSVTRSGFRYVRTTGRYVQTVTVHNLSANTFTGPLSLVLDSLSPNVTLFNRTGLTVNQLPLNSPYIRSTLSGIGNGDAMFNPGETVTFTLEFADPTNAAITYTPRVLAGQGTP